MRKFYLIMLILILIFSCTTTQDTTKEDEKTAGEKDTYYEDGLALLGRPNEDSFFTYINTIVPETPGKRDTLLQDYTGYQEELVSFFLEKGDVFNALHFYKNLFAVKVLTNEEIEAFYKQIDEKAREKQYHGFCKSLKFSRDWETGRDDFSPILPVTDYNSILTEITIKREYVNEDGVIRKDHPYQLGSGIALDAHHIMTTYHLIEDLFLKTTRSFEILVKQDTVIFTKVKVLSWDSLHDIAVLETEEEVKFIPNFYRLLGDSRIIQQGQPIFSLGHHSGYTSTLTKGIVSTVDRKAPEGGTWIQVDASVSPGAGGGMLIGEDGLLYGMILGGIVYENLNFAVPSNLILGVMDQLIQGITIKHPWLGVQVAVKKDLPDRVYFGGVFPSSPLTETEITLDDQLISLNEIPVASVRDARKVLSTLDAGNLVKMRFQNNTAEFIRYVYLKRRPDYPVYSAIKNTGRLESLYLHFGFSVDSDVRMRVEQNVKNKRITLDFYKVNKIKEDSHLEKMGVKVDDLIGILSDFYVHRTRYLEVLHVPADPESHQPEYIEDYIYHLKKEEYDENVL